MFYNTQQQQNNKQKNNLRGMYSANSSGRCCG